VLGIWFADLGDWPSEASLAVGMSASALGILLWSNAARSNYARVLLAGLVAFSLGAFSISLRLEAAARSRPVETTLRTVEATVADTAWGPGWTRVDLVDAIDVASGFAVGRIRVFGGRTPEAMPGLERVGVGTRVRARLSTRAYRGAANPGSKLRERDVARAGIGSVARLEHPALYVSILGDTWSGPTGHMARPRQVIGERLARVGRGSGIVRALAVGDKSGLDWETRKAFQRLGLSHLLAISGLHLALLGSLGFGLFRLTAGRFVWFAARFDTRTAGLVAALALASAYALIAGWGVPVRRALVMLFAVALAIGRGRTGARAEPIAMASIGVLATEPAALFDPGAQLSFAAAIAIAYSAARSSNDTAKTRLGRMVLVVGDALRVSASAIAATAPLAAWQFGSVAPTAPIANLIAIPWTGFVLLPASLLAAAATWFGSDLPAVVAVWLAALTLDAVSWTSGFVGVWTPTSDPSVAWEVGIIALAVCAIRSRRTWLRLGLSFGVSVALIVAAPTRIEPLPPRFIALDVGQGAASIVQGQHTAVLFDGGGATGSGDWGQRAIVPALRSLGIGRLDRVIVSHGDLDHRGGIPSVLERVDVDEIWIPYGAAGDPEFTTILAMAQMRRILVSERGVGSVAQLGGELTITGLWPPPGGSMKNRNNRSLVVRVDVGGAPVQPAHRAPIRVLMPGDIGASIEAALLTSGADLRSDVLALAHHGSRTSSSQAFLERVGASIAIASAPCDGRFGMPHPEVRMRANDAGMSLWWTGRDGAVIVGLSAPLIASGYRHEIRHAANRAGCPRDPSGSRNR
jgi:competence protein ComEC